MAKKWRDLYSKMPATRRAAIEAQVAKDLAEMPLQELRRARELSQVRIAESSVSPNPRSRKSSIAQIVCEHAA